MQYKKLGEICDKGSSNIVLNKIENNDGQYPLFGASGFVKNIDFYHNEKPYIGIVKDGSGVGRVDLYPAFSSLVGTMQYIFPKEDIHISYLKYLLQSLNLAKFVTGAAIPHIYFKDYSQIPVPVPSLSSQSRIVSELDLLTSLIDNQKKQLDELSKLQQSTFYSMFGDPVENEKEWPVKKLGECVTEVRYGTSKSSCPNGQYKYLRMNNITYDGNLDLRDLKTIDIPDDEIEKCIVRKGDILFNRTNSMDLIGKTCMFDLEEPMVIAGYIIRVRFTDVILPLYVSKLLNTTEYKRIFKSMAKGAVNQANINAKELQSILIPLPPLPLQTAFAEKISAIEEMKKKLKASIAETQKLFDARMQEIFG